MTKETLSVNDLWEELKSRVSVQEASKIDFFLAIKDKYDESEMWEQLPENGKLPEIKEIGDFDIDEIEEELSERYRKGKFGIWSDTLSGYLNEEYPIEEESEFPSGLAEDEWKKEYLNSIWSQYTLADIEKALPDKMLAGVTH